MAHPTGCLSGLSVLPKLPEPMEPLEEAWSTRAAASLWLARRPRVPRAHTQRPGPPCENRQGREFTASPEAQTVLRRDDGTLRYMTVREVAPGYDVPGRRHWPARRGEQMRQLGNAVPCSAPARPWP